MSIGYKEIVHYSQKIWLCIKKIQINPQIHFFLIYKSFGKIIEIKIQLHFYMLLHTSRKLSLKCIIYSSIKYVVSKNKSDKEVQDPNGKIIKLH